MNNYFVIEQNDKYLEGVVLLDKDQNVLYEDLMSMTYEEMKTYDKLEEFLFVSKEASDSHFGTNGENTIVNLVNEEDTLVWGILFGPDPDNEEYLRYCFIDWGEDGKVYKYQKEN
jgi:hypothetical protein